MTDHDRGHIDTSAAEIYDRLFVPALFGRFVEPIADAAAVGPADSVVDLACGTGALTRALRSRTSGRVIGVDVNPAMVAVAQRHGGDIEYREGDATDLGFEDGAFDVAMRQFGLCSYPYPERSGLKLTNAYRSSLTTQTSEPVHVMATAVIRQQRFRVGESHA